MKLERVLSKEEFKAVQRVALHSHDDHHLPLIAWSLGFVDLIQLEALIDDQRENSLEDGEG
jgi:hypothetical protein